MLQIGDEVVLMSAPGRFRVVEIRGSVITVENDRGIRKQVFEQSVRVVEPRKKS